MSFTPFHPGPGALVHVMAPRRVSFLAFCGANVLMDTEPLYFMLSGQEPLHRFFHTYVGATLIMAATVALFLLTLPARLAPGFGTAPSNLDFAAQFHHRIVGQIHIVRRAAGVMVHLRKQLFTPGRHAFAHGRDYCVAR